MKAIINNKRYNTDTARLLCDLPCSHYPGDFKWHDTSLYSTNKGAFFVAGKGGPMSRWAQPLGSNSWTDGSGLEPVDAGEARDILERAGATDIIEELFEVEEA